MKSSKILTKLVKIIDNFSRFKPKIDIFETIKNIHHFNEKFSSFKPEKEAATERKATQDGVDQKNFFEVDLVADHQPQAEPASDASGEEEIVIPDSCQGVDAVAECCQGEDEDHVEQVGNLKFWLSFLH